MSCFKGSMREYKGISIDRFDGKNLLSTAFFLSHCHRDHMIGLNSKEFHDRLKSRPGCFLYCSPVTQLLLLAEEEFLHLKQFIRVLQVNVSTPINVAATGREKTESLVNVTLIPAGHCPGSVMFLFEGEEGVCLYTGDFRWETNQVSKMAAFISDGRIKSIKSLYIDTTFCVTDAFHIPSRTDCVAGTVDLISPWLALSPGHVVSISCPARYGHEQLLVELSRRLDTKIHVTGWKKKLYSQIPELDGVFTDVASNSRIHACSTHVGDSSISRLPCGYRPSCDDNFKVMRIRPSTMWFTSEKSRTRSQDLVVVPASQRGIHRVCYSMHSSYSEIREVVSYLRPDQVFPNVKPASDVDMAPVQKRLNSFLDFPNKARIKEKLDADKGHFQPFGTLKRSTSSALIKGEKKVTDNDSSEELIFSSQESNDLQKKSKMENKIIKQNKEYETQKNEVVDKSSSLASAESLESHSSYSGSLPNNADDPDLFSDDNTDVHASLDLHPLKSKSEAADSLPFYVSGDSDVEEEIDKSNLLKENSFHDNQLHHENKAISKSIHLKTITPHKNLKRDVEDIKNNCLNTGNECSMVLNLKQNDSDRETKFSSQDKTKNDDEISSNDAKKNCKNISNQSKCDDKTVICIEKTIYKCVNDQSKKLPISPEVSQFPKPEADDSLFGENKQDDNLNSDTFSDDEFIPNSQESPLILNKKLIKMTKNTLNENKESNTEKRDKQEEKDRTLCGIVFSDSNGIKDCEIIENVTKINKNTDIIIVENTSSSILNLQNFKGQDLKDKDAKIIFGNESDPLVLNNSDESQDCNYHEAVENLQEKGWISKEHKTEISESSSSCQPTVSSAYSKRKTTGKDGWLNCSSLKKKKSVLSKTHFIDLTQDGSQ